jgi:hypothetical protein
LTDNRQLSTAHLLELQTLFFLLLKGITKIQLVRAAKELNEKRPAELNLLAFFIKFSFSTLK